MSKSRDRVEGGREERFGPRSIDGCSTIVLSADLSPNPLLGVMTVVIDVKSTNDPAFKPS